METEDSEPTVFVHVFYEGEVRAFSVSLSSPLVWLKRKALSMFKMDTALNCDLTYYDGGPAITNDEDLLCALANATTFNPAIFRAKLTLRPGRDRISGPIVYHQTEAAPKPSTRGRPPSPQAASQRNYIIHPIEGSLPKAPKSAGKSKGPRKSTPVKKKRKAPNVTAAAASALRQAGGGEKESSVVYSTLYDGMYPGQSLGGTVTHVPSAKSPARNIVKLERKSQDSPVRMVDREHLRHYIAAAPPHEALTMVVTDKPCSQEPQDPHDTEPKTLIMVNDEPRFDSYSPYAPPEYTGLLPGPTYGAERRQGRPPQTSGAQPRCGSAPPVTENRRDHVGMGDMGQNLESQLMRAARALSQTPQQKKNLAAHPLPPTVPRASTSRPGSAPPPMARDGNAQPASKPPTGMPICQPSPTMLAERLTDPGASSPLDSHVMAIGKDRFVSGNTATPDLCEGSRSPNGSAQSYSGQADGHANEHATSQGVAETQGMRCQSAPVKSHSNDMQNVQQRPAAPHAWADMSGAESRSLSRFLTAPDMSPPRMHSPLANPSPANESPLRPPPPNDDYNALLVMASNPAVDIYKKIELLEKAKSMLSISSATNHSDTNNLKPASPLHEPFAATNRPPSRAESLGSARDKDLVRFRDRSAVHDLESSARESVERELAKSSTAGRIEQQPAKRLEEPNKESEKTAAGGVSLHERTASPVRSSKQSNDQVILSQSPKVRLEQQPAKPLEEPASAPATPLMHAYGVGSKVNLKSPTKSPQQPAARIQEPNPHKGVAAPHEERGGVLSPARGNASSTLGPSTPTNVGLGSSGKMSFRSRSASPGVAKPVQEPCQPAQNSPESANKSRGYSPAPPLTEPSPSPAAVEIINAQAPAVSNLPSSAEPVLAVVSTNPTQVVHTVMPNPARPLSDPSPGRVGTHPNRTPPQFSVDEQSSFGSSAPIPAPRLQEPAARTKDNLLPVPSVSLARSRAAASAANSVSGDLGEKSIGMQEIQKPPIQLPHQPSPHWSTQLPPTGQRIQLSNNLMQSVMQEVAQQCNADEARAVVSQLHSVLATPPRGYPKPPFPASARLAGSHVGPSGVSNNALLRMEMDIATSAELSDIDAIQQIVDDLRSRDNDNSRSQPRIPARSKVLRQAGIPSLQTNKRVNR